VVPYLSRREGGRHVFEVLRPLAPPPSGDRAWLAETAQALNDFLGDFIRRHPDQWMWSHRRWKTPELKAGEAGGVSMPGAGGARAD
jgi:KDO2-lipid IV(A) lauroyltransferase